MKFLGRSSSRGFTLLEVLAVVVLLSMVAGTLTVHVGSVSDSARFRAAGARILDFDASARLFARSEGPVLLAVGVEGRGLTLSQVHTGEPLLRLDLGESASVVLAVEPRQSWVLIDRLGRSVDYEIKLTSGERSSHWKIAGVSGWIVPVEPVEEEEEEEEGDR